MKSKLFLLYFFFVFTFVCNNNCTAQQHTCFVGEAVNAVNQNSLGGPMSFNGLELTPRGDLRALLVFAGFEGFEGIENSGQLAIAGWNNDISPDYQLPDFVSIQNGETTTHPFFFNAVEDFENLNIAENPANQKSVSRILNLMSKPNQDFRFFGDVFTDESNTPILVSVDQADAANANSWQDVNALVIERMMEIRPIGNGDNLAYWQQFDQRQNQPNFVDDNSINTQVDDAIDYIIIMYRYDNNWPAAEQPVAGMAGWGGSGGGLYSPGGIAGANFTAGNFTFNSGITVAKGRNAPYWDFIHEFTHSIYFAPHMGGANGVYGAHFYHAQSGNGSTCNSIFDSQMNAWERWFMGYITPQEPTENTVITLDDFVTTGDAIRIPIPNSDGQSLWIENHTGLHPLDGNRFSGREIGPNGAILGPEVHNGVHMYIEDIRAIQDINNAQNDIFIAGANGIKPINASGNWDFELEENIPPINNIDGAGLFRFKALEENKIAGINPWMRFIKDMNFVNPNGIDHEANPLGFGASNGGDSEGAGIFRELKDNQDLFPYRAWSAYVNVPFKNPLFIENDEIGMNTNPMLLNYPRYDDNIESLSPFVLNGLYVKVLSIDDGGRATLEIKFDDLEVKADTRWAGNILIPNITDDSNADVILKANNKIILDKSGTIDRWTVNDITNEFINPTTLTIQQGAKFHMKYNSRILIKEHTTLVIEDGAEVLLEDKACIVVEPGGTLHYRGEDITLNGPDAVIILKGTLRTDDDIDFTFKGTGYADIHSTHVLELGVGSNFDIDRLNLPGQGTRFLQLREDTDLHIEDRMLDLKGGQVIYKSNSKISAINADVRFTMTSFVPSEDLGGTVLPIGLEGTNLKGLDIRLSTFEDLGTGVQVEAIETNPILLDNHFTRCEKGLELSQINEMVISGHIFTEQSEFSVKLSDVDDVSFVGTDILHANRAGIGCELKAVNFAYLTTGSNIDDCNIGIRSEESNVIVNNGATISNNLEGVKFINNPDAMYMLSVGNCRCGNIINNDIGVKGDNIILDIDAPTHFFSCNSEQQYGNRFDGNNLIFDICYTDPDFPIFNTILARGNFWGGQSIGNYPYILSACNIDNSVLINDAEFVTNINDIPNCESSEPFPTDPQFPSDELVKIKCEKIIEGNIVTVHTQSKLAHKDLYDKEYPVAEMKYQPVSDLDRSNDTNDRCVNLINISRCITRALENDRYAALNSYWLDEASRPLPEYQNQIAVYPNPTSGAFTIESKNEEEYFVRIISATGNTVYSSKFVNMLIVDKKDFKKGIYFLEFQKIETGNVSAQKILIQ